MQTAWVGEKNPCQVVQQNTVAEDKGIKASNGQSMRHRTCFDKHLLDTGHLHLLHLIPLVFCQLVFLKNPYFIFDNDRLPNKRMNKQVKGLLGEPADECR